ncbi:MAG: hypothetical protein ACXAC7_24135, partial [Candidatus Hodarchaeales archaeon]
MTSTIEINNDSIPDTMDIIKAERYTSSQRLHHWVHTFLMIFFFFTGFELYSDTILVGTEYFTLIIHFVLGACIGVWDLIVYPILIFSY